MNAEFFALAFRSALNPKLLVLDLLLIENRRPRAMFLCLLLGGMTVALTLGLLDVLVFHADAIKSQGTVSAGVDLAAGLLLLAVGGLVATGRLHGRRKAAVPAVDGQPEKPEKDGAPLARSIVADAPVGTMTPTGRQTMKTELEVGDRVSWNSEAGRVTGIIKKKIVSPVRVKGYTVRASKEEPQYLIVSEKTAHVAVHKGSALRKLKARASRAVSGRRPR